MVQTPISPTSIVIAAGIRSPQARAGVAFAQEDAGHLGARVARELIARANLDPADLYEVIVGCVGAPHDQANIGRVIGLRAGVPWPVPARTVARNCASGMEAVTSAVAEIQAGRGSAYLCLGVEVMSAYPLIVGRKMTAMFAKLMGARSLPARLGVMSSFRPSFLAPRVSLIEGLTDPMTGLIMGSTAELVARDFGLTRDACDAFALQSHHRARDARDAGRFAREIVPHLPQGARRGSGSMEHDDGIRDDQTLQALGKLKPYFEKPDGIVTVGNACGITDGACGLLITTEERARELGLTPLARIRSTAWAGLDPARMGLGPVFASDIALERADCRLDDMGVVEINEAFAAQVLACQTAFESDAFATKYLGRSGAVGTVDPGKLNINGGAIALGHPVGCTGARLLLTTAHEMIEQDCELGLASLCIGGGQGGAVILERVAA